MHSSSITATMLKYYFCMPTVYWLCLVLGLGIGVSNVLPVVHEARATCLHVADSRLLVAMQCMERHKHFVSHHACLAPESRGSH